MVLYSGNMGAKQGIETLADAAALLAARTDLMFVFCGSGAAKKNLLERCAGLTNCVFIPLQPVERLNELLNLADIHVLPQRGDAADLVMPSKLTGMFASGRAIVAMARRGTGLFDAVSPRGVVVPPDNVKALVAAIDRAGGSTRERRAALGRAARDYAERALSPESTIRTLRGTGRDAGSTCGCQTREKAGCAHVDVFHTGTFDRCRARARRPLRRKPRRIDPARGDVMTGYITTAICRRRVCRCHWHRTDRRKWSFAAPVGVSAPAAFTPPGWRWRTLPLATAALRCAGPLPAPARPLERRP